MSILSLHFTFCLRPPNEKTNSGEKSGQFGLLSWSCIAYSDALLLALQLLEVLLLLALSAAVSDSSSENTARPEES